MRLTKVALRFVTVLFLMLVAGSVSPVLGQQVLLDAPVQAGDLTVYPVLGEDLEPGSDYYYVPTRARLAEDARGRPQFSFLRYVENVRPGEDEETAREGEGGGIVHAVVQLDVEDATVRAAESALQRVRPGARIVGPVVYRSGTFGLVSSFVQEDGDLTRQVVGLGAAPVLEGSKAAISMRLTKLGAKILWESFEMPQPDISFVFEMQMEGLRAPIRARLEADWDRMYRHTAFGAAVATPVLAGEVAAAFDDLRDQGAIRLVQVGQDAQMDKMVQVAYDKLATLMFEPLDGTGMPSLGQLAGQGAGGGLLDRATTMLADARAEADRTAERVANATPAARPRNPQPGGQPKADNPTDAPTDDEPDDDATPKDDDTEQDTEQQPGATDTEAREDQADEPDRSPEDPDDFESDDGPDAEHRESPRQPRTTTETPRTNTVSEDDAVRLHRALVYGEHLAKFLADFTGWQAQNLEELDDAVDETEAEFLEMDPEGEAFELRSAVLQAASDSKELGKEEEDRAAADVKNLLEQTSRLRTALARRESRPAVAVDEDLLDEYAMFVTYERRYAAHTEIVNAFRNRLHAVSERPMEDWERAEFEDLLHIVEEEFDESLEDLRTAQTNREDLERRHGVDDVEMRRFLERGIATLPRASGSSETSPSQPVPGVAIDADAPGSEDSGREEEGEEGRIDTASETDTGDGEADIPAESVGEATESKPQEGAKAEDVELPSSPTESDDGAADDGAVAGAAGGSGGRDAGGGGGAGGAAGAGAGGAASGSRPGIAAVATLQLRRTRQRGTFELDMNKYMAGSQPITFSQPIGDVSRYKDDETVFRQVNLDQPLFRQREVAFRLDGLNAEDFGEYVNFIHVQLRRGADVREELTVGAEEFNERGHDFRLVYGFSGEESRDEWMRYEYRTVWSLFGGLDVEQGWEQSRDGTVALPAPYIRRTVELEGDPGALEGVRAVTARLYYTAGEEERFSELTLRPDRGETVGTADVLLPVGETEYGYEILWLYGNNDTVSSGRQRTSNPLLFLDPPQE